LRKLQLKRCEIERKNKRENCDMYSGIQHETEMSVSKRRKVGKERKTL